MKCPNCNAELEARTIFCPECGKKIDYDIVDKELNEAKKSRREHYEEALEDSPFAKIYKKKCHIWSIVIAILNMITWGMFYSNWYESKLGKVFGAGDYGLFEIFRTITQSLQRGYLDDAGIPFYFYLLLLAIIVLYLISSTYFFRSTVRIFAKKIDVKSQNKASIYALLTAAVSYITLVIFQNGFDNSIGAELSKYLISTSTFFIMFIVLNVLLLILTYSYLRNSKTVFSVKAYNIFGRVTIIYVIGLIAGLFIYCFGIKLPEIKVSSNNNSTSDNDGLSAVERYERDYEQKEEKEEKENQKIIYSYYFPESGKTRYFIDGQECDENGNLIVEDRSDIYTAFFGNQDDIIIEEEPETQEEIVNDENIAQYEENTDEDIRYIEDCIWCAGYGDYYVSQADYASLKAEFRAQLSEYYVNDFFIYNNVLYDYRGTDSEVTIPDGVTTLGIAAFAGNEYVEVVHLNKVTDSICRGVQFLDCTNLREIDNPNSIYIELESVDNTPYLTALMESWGGEWD